MPHVLPLAVGGAAPRANRFAVASAAMLCASAVAVAPMSSMVTATEIQHRAVQLTATANPVLENPLVIWQNNFANTFTNVKTLFSAVGSQPLPVLNQMIANSKDYLDAIVGAKAAPGQRHGTGILGSLEGLERTATNLPVRLQAAGEFIKQGQFTEALVELNTWALVALENIGQPLLSILTIPGDIMAAVGRVYDSLITRGTASNVTRGLLVPGITAAFAIANVADTIYTAVKEGNLKDAFTAVVNAPGIVAGAFINGYRPYFGRDADGNPIYATEDFQGLLSPRGTIDQFLVRLPQAIAAALKPPADTTAVTTVPSTATLVAVDTVSANEKDSAATKSEDGDDAPESSSGAVAADDDETANEDVTEDVTEDTDTAVTEDDAATEDVATDDDAAGDDDAATDDAADDDSADVSTKPDTAESEKAEKTEKSDKTETADKSEKSDKASSDTSASASAAA